MIITKMLVTVLLIMLSDNVAAISTCNDKMPIESEVRS